MTFRLVFFPIHHTIFPRRHHLKTDRWSHGSAKEKKCSQRRRQKSLTRWLYQRSAGSQNDLLRRSKTGDLQRTPPVSLAPPFLCPRNRFPNPVLHNVSFLRPFSSLRISQTWLRAGLKKPGTQSKGGDAVGRRGVGYARFLPSRLPAGGRVVRQGAAAAGPRRRPPPPKPGGNSSPRRHGGCTLGARQPAPLTRALSGRL